MMTAFQTKEPLCQKRWRALCASCTSLGMVSFPGDKEGEGPSASSFSILALLAILMAVMA